MRLSVMLILVAACDSGCEDRTYVRVVDSGTLDAYVACRRVALSSCNPLTQAGCGAGEKCTWIVNALTPQYIGHVGCAPIGSASLGESCSYGPPGCDGYDNCDRGLVCDDPRNGAGVCMQLCDQQGGLPDCDDVHVCVTEPDLFRLGETAPAAAGVCDLACDPLTDNDFDGSGSASDKTTMTCGSDTTLGCYGYPSFGTAPKTGWSCMAERNPTANLRHRVQCTQPTGCTNPDPTIHINSCSQGYLPLLRESSTVSTAICVALCKPKNCYAGNCGTNDENRLGEAPHRCNTIDRVGTFDTSPGGEHCTFMWYFELAVDGQFLRSPSSDTLGFCHDHAKYGLAACASLPLADAAKLGCVDSVTAGL